MVELKPERPAPPPHTHTHTHISPCIHKPLIDSGLRYGNFSLDSLFIFVFISFFYGWPIFDYGLSLCNLTYAVFTRYCHTLSNLKRFITSMSFTQFV